MRILLAQHDQVVTEKIKHSLIAEDFDVDVAAEGEAALFRAQEGNYDAIILDILLEKKNGFDVCGAISDSDTNTPILMLTTKSSPNDEIDALESGADDFLRIPFSMQVLITRVKVLLRTRDKEKNNNIVLGSFVYDQKERKCFLNEQEIMLTSRESKVLEVLILAKGEVVPKQTLFNKVWGTDFDGTVNIVEVYIGYLRRKICVNQNNCSTQACACVLQTVRGIGYRLVSEAE